MDRPDRRSLWELIRTDFWANQQAIIRSLADRAALRPGLDVKRATDLLRMFNHPEIWLLLVDRRRAGHRRNGKRWFAATCQEQLLAPG